MPQSKSLCLWCLKKSASPYFKADLPGIKAACKNFRFWH
ncbi:Hypothetical protein I595_1886 [Croceitalea dokdonensis DOKDO 023]|uniref:Uncharacterized protein n=1 Tax=Croceitalea dokdonensis DOKDO 023 TaxID=1300341 RepID=A0A0N8H431_9FLAO|nr:Hypothetical protein I595_1886 [Croceitalea dokdonensis DOKDO 023]